MTATARKNLQTHTMAVHAPGRNSKLVSVGYLPKCCASAGAAARYHFLMPVDLVVTCKRCLAALAKEAD